jgi:hypothetical protein
MFGLLAIAGSYAETFGRQHPRRMTRPRIACAGNLQRNMKLLLKGNAREIALHDSIIISMIENARNRG